MFFFYFINKKIFNVLKHKTFLIFNRKENEEVNKNVAR